MRSLHPWPVFPTHLEPNAARALSLQFLLHELISAFNHLDELENKLELPMEIDEISIELEKFLLFSLENPLLQKGGTLDKLCFYSEILLQNSCVDEDTNIPNLLEEMRRLTLDLRTKIFSHKKSKDRDGSFEKISSGLLDLVKDAQKFMRQIFDSIYPFLREAREDENVLFLLIEQKDQINHFLGSRTVETVLARLFPQGICSLRAALYNGYARRGFLDFYSRNEMLIDALEWEDSCSLSALKR